MRKFIQYLNKMNIDSSEGVLAGLGIVIFLLALTISIVSIYSMPAFQCQSYATKHGLKYGWLTPSGPSICYVYGDSLATLPWEEHQQRYNP